MSGPLPDTFIERMAPDTLRTVRLAEGVWYRYAWSPVGPWAIHLVEADLRRCSLDFDVLLAESVTGSRRSFATVSAMAKAGGAVASVNGDFYLREGIPAGSEVVAGELRRIREFPAFVWQADRTPRIGFTTAEGMSGLSLDDEPLQISQGLEVVGGRPELLRAGARVPYRETNPGFATGRHPRTAVGFAPGRDRLWLLVVDGRQSPYSAGMTLSELTGLFEQLGATEALNLDGGGSSSMVLGGRTVNRPSDGEDRPVVNALGLRVDPTGCER